jgi:Tol biopolymer transport system component
MPYFDVHASPDGARITTSVFGASDAVFVYDLARRTNTRVTFRGNCTYGAWMPDSTHLTYISDADGPPALYETSADGAGTAERVIDTSVRVPREIALVQGQPAAVYADGGDIWLQPLRSTERRKLVGTPFEESVPHVSPDGKWLSYLSRESGQDEVYIRPISSDGGRWQVSRGLSVNSCWAPDTSAIFCVDKQRHVYRSAFRTDPSVEIGAPQLLFTLTADIGDALEPHPDGKRFLTARDLPPRFRAEQVCVVLNWFEELKAKVPTASR